MNWLIDCAAAGATSCCTSGLPLRALPEASVIETHTLSAQKNSGHHSLQQRPFWLLPAPTYPLKLQAALLDGPLSVINGPERIEDRWENPVSAITTWPAPAETANLDIWIDTIDAGIYMGSLPGGNRLLSETLPVLKR